MELLQQEGFYSIWTAAVHLLHEKNMEVQVQFSPTVAF